MRVRVKIERHEPSNIRRLNHTLRPETFVLQRGLLLDIMQRISAMEVTPSEIFSLRLISNPELKGSARLELLHVLTESYSESTKIAAAQVLGSIGNKAFIPKIRKVYQMQNEEVKRELQRTINFLSI